MGEILSSFKNKKSTDPHALLNDMLTEMTEDLDAEIIIVSPPDSEHISKLCSLCANIASHFLQPCNHGLCADCSRRFMDNPFITCKACSTQIKSIDKIP